MAYLGKLVSLGEHVSQVALTRYLLVALALVQLLQEETRKKNFFSKGLFKCIKPSESPQIPLQLCFTQYNSKNVLYLRLKR